jgi:hypothetical protein
VKAALTPPLFASVSSDTSDTGDTGVSDGCVAFAAGEAEAEGVAEGDAEEVAVGWTTGNCGSSG